MQQIDILKLIESKNPNFFKKFPKYLSKTIIYLLNKVLHVKDINHFISLHNDLTGLDFIDGLFKYLNFKFSISKYDLSKIPATGKLIIVSNHPLGGLDGLALIKAVSLVRKDVRIVVNDILSNINNLNEVFLPYDLYSVKTQKKNIQMIENNLKDERCVMFFPAALVSRLTRKGIRDRKWQKGALRLAHKFNTPILPIFVNGRNSILFYLLALIHDKVGTFLLPHELFNKRDETLDLKVGNIIPYQSLKSNDLNEKKQNEILQEHIFNIGKDGEELFNTLKPVIEPVNKELLIEELNHSELLGNTLDGKRIFLSDYDKSKNLVREIARLREITFRLVGIGTGKEMDFIDYDKYYKHMILWNDEENEIIGAYRIGQTKEIIEKYGKKGLMTANKFEFNDNFDYILNNSLEVGRAFIQQKYWNSQALDYMWQGIGAYILKNDDIRYLWGTVSISDELPQEAKDLIAFYYMKWYKGYENFAKPHIEYKLSEKKTTELEKIFNTGDYKNDFKILKRMFSDLGYSIPVLYRKYVDITNFGGTKFVDFCLDSSFNSLEGFIVVDLKQLKDEIKERYYTQKSFIKTND